jgi:translation initiation factor 2B subunit (eIF-2B alpha/beta/delta family)
MDAGLRREIRTIAADSRSSATELLSRGLKVLRSAAGAGADVLAEAANELVRAQPAMAGLRTAAALALGSKEPGAAIDVFAARIDRIPGQIARHALGVVALRTGSGPLRIVTVSRSRLVEQTIRLAAAEQETLVSCAEGRPAREGLALARSLADAQIPVDLFTDAGIASAVPGADVVLVGADAVSGDAFINKVGTSAVCALATSSGVPVYLLAGREKVLPDDVFKAITLRPGSPHEVARDLGVGVHIRNPYFEVIPLRLMSSIVSDIGVLQADEIGSSGLWR